MNDNGFTVFLAHASENKPEVRVLRDKLQKDGIPTWIDEVNLRPGVLWPEEIPRAISDSDIFLACLSEAAVRKTGYIQRELRYGLMAFSERPPGQVFLIPAKLDACEVPPIQLPELGRS